MVKLNLIEANSLTHDSTWRAFLNPSYFCITSVHIFMVLPSMSYWSVASSFHSNSSWWFTFFSLSGHLLPSSRQPWCSFHATFWHSRVDTRIRGDENDRPLKHILSWAGKWVLPGLCLPLFLPPPITDQRKESRNPWVQVSWLLWLQILSKHRWI